MSKNRVGTPAFSSKFSLSIKHCNCLSPPGLCLDRLDIPRIGGKPKGEGLDHVAQLKADQKGDDELDDLLWKTAW